MTTAELRKQLKSLGYKLKISSSSLGRHAAIIHIASGCTHGNVEGAEGVDDRWGKFHEWVHANRDAILAWGKEEGTFGQKSWFQKVPTI